MLEMELQGFKCFVWVFGFVQLGFFKFLFFFEMRMFVLCCILEVCGFVLILQGLVVKSLFCILEDILNLDFLNNVNRLVLLETDRMYFVGGGEDR